MTFLFRPQLQAHALPPLQATPKISKLNNNISEISVSGKWHESTVYKLFSISKHLPKLKSFPEYKIGNLQYNKKLCINK